MRFLLSLAFFFYSFTVFSQIESGKIGNGTVAKTRQQKTLPNAILTILNDSKMFRGNQQCPTIALTPRLANFMTFWVDKGFCWDPAYVHACT